MSFPCLRWGPGVEPTAFEILDFRVRAMGPGRPPTEAEKRAWASEMLGLGLVTADEIRALVGTGQPPVNDAADIEEASRRCAEADRCGYR